MPSSSLLLATLALAAPSVALQREPAGVRAPEPAPLLDARTQRRIVGHFDGARSAGELGALLGLEAHLAERILALRTGRPGERFASFEDLGAVWELHPTVFPRAYHVLGPPGMGMWETLPYTLPYSCAHSILLHTGEVLLLPEFDEPAALLWDPADLEQPRFEELVAPGFLFCGGHAQLSDGRILFAGGGGNFARPRAVRAYTYAPESGGPGTWFRLPDMAFQRWYPTVLTLGGGRALVAGGRDSEIQPIGPMEVFDESTNQFTIVTGTPADPGAADLYWNETYPGLHLLPSGQILFTRTGHGHGETDTGTRARLFTWSDPLDPRSGSWRDTAPMVFPDRSEGVSVLLPLRADLAGGARVAVFGGGHPVEDGQTSIEVLERADRARARWVRRADLLDARVHALVALLPDGNALVAGGAEHFDDPDPRSSELYDPRTHRSTRMDDARVARGYHGLCVLLPSGQVVIGGGSFDEEDELTLEVFSPPYLFRGPRPVIASAPAEIVHGAPFEVATPDAARIARAVLVRPMSFTHATDSEQRLVELHPKRNREGLAFEAPGGAPPYPLAPSGYYMLFLVDHAGVPSTAVFVRLK